MILNRKLLTSILAVATVITAFALMPGTARAHSEDFTPALVDKLLTPYLGIQSGLASDNLDAAKQAAAQFAEAMKAAPVSGDAKEEAAALIDPAKAIAEASDIAAARVTFNTLSKEFITLVRHKGTTRKEPLYVLECPMAMNNQGAQWIQADKTVANPYFGASMLRCGSVQGETGLKGTHNTGTSSHDGHH